MKRVNHWLLRARQTVANPKATAAHVLTGLARSLMPERVAEATSPSLEEIVLERFYDDEIGRAYNVNRKTKAQLVERFKENTK
jgi:hypothetical protein